MKRCNQPIAFGLLLLGGTLAAPLSAQTAPAPVAPANDEEIVKLSPFEVSASKDVGYQALETLAGTRIRTNLADVGSAISVVTVEFLNDVGATDNGTLLQYTTNAEVAGTHGSYAGLGNATSVDETTSLRIPENYQRVRGLAPADKTRDFFTTDIPWDSFNVDRIDIQRGPNSILFGLGSPAGIINASTHSADFRDGGQVAFRVGSYGSARSSLDLNQELVHNVLAIRVDGLWNDQKFEQKQAFDNSKRYYGALRFDPKLFNDPSYHTSIKVKFENGDTKANRPRIIPPSDSLTPWFRPVNNSSLTGGMGKLVLNNAYGIGAQPQNTNPWLTAAINQQQAIWMVDGATASTYQIMGGYINNGFLNSTGGFAGAGSSAQNQTYSDQFYGVNSLQSFATNAKTPGYQYGQFRQQSLLDPSIFDFYHNLIDGSTKSEFERWTAYNIDLSQTAFDDRLGIDVSYDRQKYIGGGQALLGNPTLTIDILQHFLDLSANPNFGRPYILGGPGGGSSYRSDRTFKRASIYGELRASDFLHNDFLVKLLGKHRINLVGSDELYQTENRTWQMYANSRAWAAYWNATDGSSDNINDRPPVAAIYLGPSLASASSAQNAHISAIGAPVTLQSGNVYTFNSTWTGLGLAAGQTYASPWTLPANLTPVFNTTVALTQASNPANYVGWNQNFQDNLIVDNNDTNQALTTHAAKSYRETKSYAGSWQGFMWNDAIIPNLGWRYDEVQSKSVTAQNVTLNRGELDQGSNYSLPSVYSGDYKNHSTAGGLVVHLNKLFGAKDPLPIDIGLSYNKSNNFQVTDARVDVYGKPIANPTGTTKEFGVTLATKDGKYSLRVVKYETKIFGGTTTLNLQPLNSVIVQGLKFRNVFLYQLSGYTWDTREQTDDTAGKRYFWTPAYLNAAGRPVADLTGTPAPVPAGSTLETQAQADAHRDASIAAWNSIQSTLDAAGYFKAWNFTPTTLSALTTRSVYAATLTTVGSTDGKPIPAAQYQPVISSLASYSANNTPVGEAVTADSTSKGYEFELTANPTPNWRLEFNASQTEAIQKNVGGTTLDALVNYMDTQMAGYAGDMRQYNGNYVPGNELRYNYASWRSQYTLLKLQEGSNVPELRKWRFNLVTNYSFTNGLLKGAGVGGGYRWEDKVVIGYPVIPGTGVLANFDLSKPYYGPSEGAVDLWVSYERKLSKALTWKIQINVRNAFAKNGLIPISVEPDGQTWASVRTKPVQEWFATNTFSF